MVQFCCRVSIVPRETIAFHVCSVSRCGAAYSTDNDPASSAVPHHISGASSHATAGQAVSVVALVRSSIGSYACPCVLGLPEAVCELRTKILLFIDTVESLLDKLGPKLQEVRSELTACQGKVMEAIEVEMRC